MSVLSQIVSAIKELTESVNKMNSKSPWLNQKQAYERIGISQNSFKSLVEHNVIPKHTLDKYGIAITRYHSDEIDNWLLKQK
ncbi:hypothetical protein WOSG25_250050 [Weissella oryzae SG25]|uniref:Helix-turn-helix domain-containing protein n=1 Tax=Weissella oryzae (strain DSM 25784 / JCM 18191 / LMG 30913 / SG25) TaxID=1329250 RepID=A0A069CX29_WEIOS|nr:hypothetical protein [Weissella oryzae]GAK32034.1 hypothetical protein WOSG25_250050 [Weissella oryzae SG25]